MVDVGRGRQTGLGEEWLHRYGGAAGSSKCRGLATKPGAGGRDEDAEGVGARRKKKNLKNSFEPQRSQFEGDLIAKGFEPKRIFSLRKKYSRITRDGEKKGEEESQRWPWRFVDLISIKSVCLTPICRDKHSVPPSSHIHVTFFLAQVFSSEFIPPEVYIFATATACFFA